MIAGNTSDSLHRTMREILVARQAFRHVVFVDGPCEHHSGQAAPHGSDELQRFAEQHDGIHYLGDGPGVVIDHTLVCGIAGWHSLHIGANRQQTQEMSKDDHGTGTTLTSSISAPPCCLT